MSFFSSLTKGLKNIGKTIVKSFSSSSGLATGGLGTDYVNSLGDAITRGLKGAWEDYTGKAIAEKNLAAQEKQWKIQNALNERQFAYQQQLNTQQMQREDTAMQRKVVDLKAAGLNPVLAANGTGAPSAALSAPSLKAPSAPQLGDYSGGVREGLGTAANLVLQAITMKKDFAMKDAEIRKMNAEKDYFDTLKGKVSAETTGLNIDNETKAQFNEARVQSINLDNELKSATLQNNILMSYKKLRQVDLDYENSLLDRDLKKLNISHESVLITQDQLKNKLYVQDSELKQLALTAKTVEILRSVAEYNSYLFDVDFYNRLHNLPVGYNIPMLGRNTDYIKGLLSSAWNEVKDFANGHIDIKRLSDSVSSVVSYTEKMLDDVSKSLGISKNELIYSFRRGDDGVRRNHGMFYVGGRR